MDAVMRVTPTPIDGVIRVDTTMHTDARGAFARLYCERELASFIEHRRIVQVNLSRTSRVGAVRGMHFQYPPHCEMKLIRCVRGRVWDVAVDLRRRSSTFLKWHAEVLSPEGTAMMVIPEGCAHGFQVLEPESELLYLHTAAYAPDAESGVRVDDGRLGIAWPLPISHLSARDAAHLLLDDAFRGVEL